MPILLAKSFGALGRSLTMGGVTRQQIRNARLLCFTFPFLPISYSVVSFPLRQYPRRKPKLIARTIVPNYALYKQFLQYNP